MNRMPTYYVLDFLASVESLPGFVRKGKGFNPMGNALIMPNAPWDGTTIKTCWGEVVLEHSLKPSECRRLHLLPVNLAARARTWILMADAFDKIADLVMNSTADQLSNMIHRRDPLALAYLYGWVLAEDGLFDLLALVQKCEEALEPVAEAQE